MLGAASFLRRTIGLAALALAVGCRGFIIDPSVGDVPGGTDPPGNPLDPSAPPPASCDALHVPGKIGRAHV